VTFGFKEKPRTIVYKKVLKRGFMLGALFAVMTLNSVLAAGPPTTADVEEQNRRARQAAEERQVRDTQQDVNLQQGKKSDNDSSLPEETLSFVVNTIKLEGDDVKKFPWAKAMLAKYQGRKLGIKGIHLIVKRLTNAMIDRGYVTTRVVIPEQNLSGGVLKLVLVPGKIRAIRFDEPSTLNNWKTAFPARSGDILNLRDLEQGLEQMKRVSSQDVSMKLVPGNKPGESDVVITVKRTKQWKAVLSYDNAGTKPTGKQQLGEVLAVDNLFGLNDLFNISFNNDVECQGTKLGTRGDSLYYSVPNGNSTYTFSTSSYRYHQTVSSTTQSFISSGESSTQDFKISQLVHRDQTGKTSLEFGISRKHSNSYIDDTEIEVQRKNTTAARIGLVSRRYLGKATLDIGLTYKKGVPWCGAELPTGTGQATTRYNMGLADIGLTTPVALGKIQGRYRLTLYGQYTNNTLYQTDMLSIGNRYTVRGFDGENTLYAEKGWYVQNEISAPLKASGLEWYAGLDYGEVSGPSAESLTGRCIAGTVVGIRGGGKSVQYDLFVGCPIRKPDSFTTGKCTFGFQVISKI